MGGSGAGVGKGKNGLVSDTNSFLPGAFEFSCWCLEGDLRERPLQPSGKHTGLTSLAVRAQFPPRPFGPFPPPRIEIIGARGGDRQGGRAGQGWAGLGRAGQGWAGLGRAGQGWAGLGRAGQGWAGRQGRAPPSRLLGKAALAEWETMAS